MGSSSVDRWYVVVRVRQVPADLSVVIISPRPPSVHPHPYPHPKTRTTAAAELDLVPLEVLLVLEHLHERLWVVGVVVVVDGEGG